MNPQYGLWQSVAGNFYIPLPKQLGFSILKIMPFMESTFFSFFILIAFTQEQLYASYGNWDLKR